MKINLKCVYCGSSIRANWLFAKKFGNIDIMVYPCSCIDKAVSPDNNHGSKSDFQLLKDRVEKIELKMQAERA